MALSPPVTSMPMFATEHASFQSGPPPLPPPAPAREATVWIVEDEPHYRDVFGQLLGRANGVRLGGAFGSVEEALEAIGQIAGPGSVDAASDAALRPDLILLDINLPGVSGLEGVCLLKSALPQVRVVILTIRDDAETIFAALRAGASGYLLKDSPIEMLLSGVEQAVTGALLMPPRIAERVLAFFDNDPHTVMPDYGLSARERGVLEGMTKGLTQKQIAEALFLSPSTVNGHVQRLYEKLGVNSASAAVAKALKERLV